jgi:hypothetical protein
MIAFLLVRTFFVVQGIPAYAEVLPNSSQSVESNISISPRWTSINDITLICILKVVRPVALEKKDNYPI